MKQTDYTDAELLQLEAVVAHPRGDHYFVRRLRQAVPRLTAQLRRARSEARAAAYRQVSHLLVASTEVLSNGPGAAALKEWASRLELMAQEALGT